MTETITIEIHGALKDSIKDRIKIAKLTNEAWQHFKEDKKSGQWQSDNLSDYINKKTANRDMLLAHCCADTYPVFAVPSAKRVIQVKSPSTIFRDSHL